MPRNLPLRLKTWVDGEKKKVKSSQVKPAFNQNTLFHISTLDNTCACKSLYLFIYLFICQVASKPNGFNNADKNQDFPNNTIPIACSTAFACVKLGHSTSRYKQASKDLQGIEALK